MQIDHHRAVALRFQEDFLAELANQLRADLSPLELDETIRELRAHLHASTCAYEEMGFDPLEAAQAAIDALGAPDRIGPGLRAEARRERWDPVALSATGLASAAWGTALLTVAWFVYHSLSNGAPAEIRPELLRTTALYGGAYGATVGLCLDLRPRSLSTAAVRAALILTALNIVMSLVYSRLDRMLQIGPMAYVLVLGAGFGLGAAVIARAVDRSRVPAKTDPPAAA